MKKRTPKPTVEVVPHAEAPWAPPLPGARWAYRATTVGGTEVSGATRGNKAVALRAAQRTAERLHYIERGGTTGFNGVKRPEAAHA